MPVPIPNPGDIMYASFDGCTAQQVSVVSISGKLVTVTLADGSTSTVHVDSMGRTIEEACRTCTR